MFTYRRNERFLVDQIDEEGVHNCEQSSDGGNTSNSDAEPEDENSDSDEDYVPESMEGVAVSKRNWQRTPPMSSATLQNCLRKCSLTEQSEHIQTEDDCFHLFINEAIIDDIILWTNKKASDSMPSNKTWKRIDRIEMDAFFGLLLLIGRFKESRECKSDLWKDDAFSRRFYAAVMSRDRFTDILRYMRFDNAATRKARKMDDKLAPIRHVTDTFVENCKTCYNASDIGCVDELLVAFRGRCSFKVNVPSKPGKCGIKVWTLCDTVTFYCCNMEVYLGQSGNNAKKQQDQRVVKRIVDFWENSGRSIVTDNIYIDLDLGEYFLERNLFLVGNLRKNTRDIPKNLTETKHRSLYSSEYLFTEKLTIVSYIPKMRKRVFLLSTMHHDDSICTEEEEKFKPEIMQFHNASKNGVDLLDTLVKEYSCRRCTSRWTLSLFMHYLDIAAYNAFVIWCIKYPTGQNKTSFQRKRKYFLDELAKKLTNANIDRRAKEIEFNRAGLKRSIVSAIEATGRKILKPPRAAGQKRARCCFCIGSNNRYSAICAKCQRHVCNNHCTKSQAILCNICEGCE